MRVITGKAKGHPLKAPRNMFTRPMSDRVKVSLFSILMNYDATRGRILDLYAGTGALGIESLSRGADWADFVEQSAAVCKIIAHNLEVTHFTEQAYIYNMPVSRYLNNTQDIAPYNLIFMDPPYADPHIEQTISSIATSGLNAPEALLVVGHSIRKSLSDSYTNLQKIDFRRIGDSCFSIFDWSRS
jgi:16S rRNA (guanine966-N2)-methyltransferase